MASEGVNVSIYIVMDGGSGYRQIYPVRGGRLPISTGTPEFYGSRPEDAVVWGTDRAGIIECIVKKPKADHRQIEFNIKRSDDIGDVARCFAASVEAFLQLSSDEKTEVAVFLE